MRNLNQDNITQAVLQTFENTPDERLKEIMTAVVNHLHALVRELNLTEAEWMAAIQFLTTAGQMCSPSRQEFILLSDTLGVSTLKDLLNNRRPEDVTDWSILGPFYREGAPELRLGASIAGDTPGEPILLAGHVKGQNGEPIPNALLDVWQSDAEGFYDLQVLDLSKMNLRGCFRTDTRGRYEFRTIKPSFYPIPEDGPVGKMLRAVGRHPYRPAHIHFKVSADGYVPLTTELYMEGDPYIDSDVVFGVRSALIVNPVRHESAQEAARQGLAAPFYTLEYDFVLPPMG